MIAIVNFSCTTTYCIQLQSTLQGVKSDNPAQFERVNLCIERCQQLEKTGYRVTSTKNKHQLLRELQEELKIVSQEEMTRSLSQLPHRHTLLRSNTSVQGGRPLRISKRRLSTPYISPLTMIGEEESEVASATLPRHLEQRPKTLLMRGRAITTGSALPGALKKTADRTSPLSVKKTVFADEIELKPIVTGKQSPSPRLSPRSLHAADSKNSPVRSNSPLKSPRRVRAPKLAVLGKFGSSGFYADDEDDQAEVEVQPSRVTIQLPKPEENGVDQIVVPNTGAVSAGNSPIPVQKQVKNKKHHITVTAEVHINSDNEDEESNFTTTRVTFSSDGSRTPLLPSPEVRRNKKVLRRARPASPFSKSGSDKSKDQSDELSASFGDDPLDSETKVATRDNLRKGSLSLDRKHLSGLKELNSAVKESKNFMYHSLGDAMDYSQC